MKAQKIPKSIAGRLSRLIGTSAKVVGREALSRMRRSSSQIDKLATQIEHARDLVSALSELKGAAMKAGQLLSLEFSDLLPPEITEILRTLHDQATMMPPKDVARILKKELGDRLNQITDLEPEPFASASIGQVHRAKIEGRDVVLKIQYPGVAKTIDADLAVLKQVVRGLLAMASKDILVDGLFAELSKGLKFETDYLRESKSLQHYKEQFLYDQRFIIPKVYEEFTTKRVLTLSFEPGIKLVDYLETNLGEEDRAYFADLILDLIFSEFFKFGIVQTDPNYGNFLWRTETKQLVLLDFGATRTYSKVFRKKIRRLLDLSINRKERELLELAFQEKLLDERESSEVKDLFVQFIDKIVSIFREEAQPFHYRNAEYLAEIRAMSLGFASQVKYTSPAQEMIFLNRKLGGMFHLLKDANCSVDLHAYWQKVARLDL